MNWSDSLTAEDIAEERRETFSSMAVVVYALATVLALALAVVCLVGYALT